jgi:hypothetical protein
MSEKLIALLKVQPRKVRAKSGRKEPSSYMMTIPKDAVEVLEVRVRRQKVKVFLEEEKKRLIYDFA